MNWSADEIKIVRRAPSRDADNIFGVFVLTSKGHVKYDAAGEIWTPHVMPPPLTLHLTHDI